MAFAETESTVALAVALAETESPAPGVGLENLKRRAWFPVKEKEKVAETLQDCVE